MSREIDLLDNYVVKILKLIPAEVSAAYTAINFYLKDYASNFWLLVVFGVILMVTCYFLIKWQTQNNRQAVVTSLAFLIWAANISGALYLTTQESAVLACVLVLSTIFLPRLYQR